jgi:hypothetical protein
LWSVFCELKLGYVSTVCGILIIYSRIHWLEVRRLLSASETMNFITFSLLIFQDQGSVPVKRKRGRKPRSLIAQQTTPVNSALTGIESIRSSSHNVQRFQNLNDVLVARKNSQHLRSPLTQKRPSSCSSVSSEDLMRHQPSPDQSTNPKRGSATKKLSNDDVSIVSVSVSNSFD